MSLSAEAIDVLMRAGEPVGSVIRVLGVDGVERPYAVQRDGDTVKVMEIEDPRPALVKPLEVPTLAALVGYLQRNIDGFDLMRYQLVVASPARVELQSQLFSAYKVREVLIVASAPLPALLFGNWLTLEQAHIWLRVGFEERVGGDRARLLALLSQITTEASVKTEDNGVSQKVSTVKGLTLKEETAVPSTVELAPYRSFVGEVEQVASACIFRVKGGEGKPVEVQLQMADGGAWNLEARKRLAEKLRTLLAGAGLDPALVVG